MIAALFWLGVTVVLIIVAVVIALALLGGARDDEVEDRVDAADAHPQVPDPRPSLEFAARRGSDLPVVRGLSGDVPRVGPARPGPGPFGKPAAKGFQRRR
jgi:hypothetical protein